MLTPFHSKHFETTAVLELSDLILFLFIPVSMKILHVLHLDLLFISWIFICFLSDLKEMCELLGIEQSVLERAFSYRTVEAKLEKVSTTLNVAQVRGQRGSSSDQGLMLEQPRCLKT